MLRSSAEWVGRGLTPVYASRSPASLTRGGVACRSEPGILSARPLRGSEGVNAFRWGERAARGSEGVDCSCGSSTKIRRRSIQHPTKPPDGRHGGVYKGRWSTTTLPYNRNEGISAIRRRRRRTQGTPRASAQSGMEGGEGAPRARGTTRVEAQPVGRGMWGEAEEGFYGNL